MRKKNTFNQGWDENLICRSLEFFASQKIGMTFLFCLLSGVTHAQCVPAPDCGELGYTAESCEGDALKCPFDTSKLYCIPCDSSYKYTCSGENITGGVGSSCGGKYISCLCSGGGTFNNGSCPQNCTVGMIYYSDKSCSSTYDNSKTVIGVVVKDNELVVSQRSSYFMYWANDNIDTSLDNYASSAGAKDDLNGKSNTATILTDDASNVAAKYCNNYTTTGTSAGDWYLPAAGELYSYVYGNYSAINTAMTSLGWSWEDVYLWSSSESDYNYVWYVNTSSGRIYYDCKNCTSYYISCFLEI